MGRAGEHGKQALSRVLKSLGQANPEIAEILLEFCITELEDVVAEVFSVLFQTFLFPLNFIKIFPAVFNFKSPDSCDNNSLTYNTTKSSGRQPEIRRAGLP